jgi:response regulator RpfG family c-di-GMP phosphodiesterase
MASADILFVDDDADILAGFQRTLRKEFRIETALGGEAALTMCAGRAPYELVVADMQMPGMNGVEFLIQIKERYPDTVRIMLTGNADQETAREAVNKGHIFRFLTKPCPPEELFPALRAGVKQYQLVTAERQLLEQTLNGCAKALSEVLSIHDPYSFGRGNRMREYMKLFADSLKLSQTWDLELAAMLSQIGCVSVPQNILEKAHHGAALSGPELDVMARVPKIGSELLGSIPRLENVAQIILYQNKNFDGSGFPLDSICGEAIPVGARILRVLHDLFVHEADNKTKEKALELMTRCAGYYDPKVLEAVAASFDICLSAPENGPRPKAVSLKDLHVGHILKSTAHTKEGLLIAPNGTQVTPILLEKLRNISRLNELAEPILILDA